MDKNINNDWNLTVFIQNGRIYDNDKQLVKSGLLKTANLHTGNFRLTGNQNIVISKISDKNKKKIEEIAISYKLIKKASPLHENSMACVSFPTCLLAMAEAEGILSFLLLK